MLHVLKISGTTPASYKASIHRLKPELKHMDKEVKAFAAAGD